MSDAKLNQKGLYKEDFKVIWHFYNCVILTVIINCHIVYRLVKLHTVLFMTFPIKIYLFRIFFFFFFFFLCTCIKKHSFPFAVWSLENKLESLSWISEYTDNLIYNNFCSTLSILWGWNCSMATFSNNAWELIFSALRFMFCFSYCSIEDSKPLGSLASSNHFIFPLETESKYIIDSFGTKTLYFLFVTNNLQFFQFPISLWALHTALERLPMLSRQSITSCEPYSLF